MVGELLGSPPEDVYGSACRCELGFQRMDDELTLPQWRPAGTAPAPAEAVRDAETAGEGCRSCGSS